MTGNIDQLAIEIKKQFGFEYCVTYQVSPELIKVQFACDRQVNCLELVGPVGIALNKKIVPFRIQKATLNDLDESSYAVFEYYISI